MGGRQSGGPHAFFERTIEVLRTRGHGVGGTMSKRELVLSTKKLPPGVRMLCGNHPVLSSEKLKEYESLFSYMADCVNPTDIIEWLWLKDVVDHTWEIRRLRRFKRQLIEVGLINNSEAPAPRINL